MVAQRVAGSWSGWRGSDSPEHEYLGEIPTVDVVLLRFTSPSYLSPLYPQRNEQVTRPMRVLNESELDQVCGGQRVSSTWQYTQPDVRILDRDSALRALKNNTVGAAFISGSLGPGAAARTVLAGGAWSMINIFEHTKVVTPRITIEEIRGGASLSDDESDS